MPQATSLKLRGVATHKNRMSEVREGALARAENLIIDRESIAEPRRGLPYYGDAISAGANYRRLIPYEAKLIAHVSTTLYRDNGSGTWTSYSGTFTEPASGYRLRDAQSNGNLYVTSATGIRKLDELAGTWRSAGLHSPLDGRGTLSGASGFLADDSAVGYRATFYYADANGNEIESAPSHGKIIQNSAGGTRDVALTWYLPTGLTTSHFYRIYRSG